MTTTATLSIITFLKKLLSFIIGFRKDRKEQEYQEDLQDAKDELKFATENGDLSDLLEASKKLGEVKKNV